MTPRLTRSGTLDRMLDRTLDRTLVGVLIALVTCLVALVGLGSTASAGGWAVTTLDATPAPVPGEDTDIGFTIRQHGVTPVDIDDGVAIAVTAADGAVQVFPAIRQGATGHYVATVVFPDAGEYVWRVHQGPFEPQDLGTLTVRSTSSAASDHRFPAAVRYGLPALATACALAAVVDLVAGRRRRQSVAA